MDYSVADLAKTVFMDHRAVFGSDASFRGFSPLSSLDVRVAGTPCTLVCGNILYSSNGLALKSFRLLVKCFSLDGPPSEVERRYELFTREKTFYETVVPAFEQVKPIGELVPKLWGCSATISASSNCAVFLFAWPDGVVNFDSHTLLTESRILDMVNAIAEFHAYSVLIRRQNADFFNNQTLLKPPITNFQHVLPKLRQCWEEYRGNDIYHRVAFEHIIAYFKHYLNWPFAPNALSQCRVLCHQNYSKRNLIFQNGSFRQPTIFNWQSMGVASLAVDLVMVLIVESNKEWISSIMWSEFVKQYHRVLCQLCGTLDFSLQDIIDEIMKCVAFAMYVTADRIIEAEAEARASPLAPAPLLWNDSRLVELYAFLFSSGYFQVIFNY